MNTPDRVTAGVGDCASATAREGEGLDPRPRRVGGRASADAVAAREEKVRSTDPRAKRACSTYSRAAVSSSSTAPSSNPA
jgi:hypothetical protein